MIATAGDEQGDGKMNEDYVLRVPGQERGSEIKGMHVRSSVCCV
jgi:hypothetical protein